MSKRGAASELTHDNWNEEDEPEEAGTFRKASAESMATRKIKTAKRRDASGSAAGGGTSIFKEMSGFANFGAKTDNSAPSFSFFNKDSSKSSSNTTPSFSFGKTDSEPKKSIFGGEETKSSSKSTFSFSNTNGTSESTTAKKEEGLPKINGFGSSEKSVTSEKKTDSPFMTELKSLNETFLKWIKQHLDENVYVNLTPVLEDYKKYFQKISEKKSDGKASDKKEESNEKENKPLSSNVISKEPDSSGDGGTSDKVADAPKPAFSFSSKTDDTKKPEFSFGLSKTDDSSKPSSIFGNDSNSSNSGSGVKFGTGAPLTFGGLSDSSSKPFSFGGFATAPVATPATKEKTEEEENEDEPPKVIVNEVKEDDAIYEKKCKLFYMKDKEYVERGLGTIFLKKADEKTQLIVRANTNLGNILLNIIVGPSIGAMMRVGKNNVMVVCIPNPPIDPKSDNKTPVKMLIRVKTSEDADELLKILEEHKG